MGMNGAWDARYCGGSPSHDTFPANPQWRITTFAQCHVRFVLEAPIKLSINIQLYLCVDDEHSKEGGKASNYDDDDNALSAEENGNENAKSGKIVNRADYAKELLVADSGPYRFGLAVADAYDLAAGRY